MKHHHSQVLKTLVLVSALSSSLAFAGNGVSPAAAVVAASAQPGCTNMSDPVSATKIVVADILDVLKRDQQSINGNFSKVEDDVSKVLSPNIDINKIADFVIPAELMKQATESERQAARDVLLAFFISSYSAAFRSFSERVHVTVHPLRSGMERNDTVQINTTVFTDDSGNPNSAIPLALVATRDKSACKWKYVDFVVDNISAVSNVQSQIFGIKAKSLVELTNIIRKHNEEVAKGM